MSDHWPLLVSDPLDGDRLVNRQLRPRAAAFPVDRSDFIAAHQTIVDLCGTWGGAGMPLLPVTRGSAVDEQWSRILNETNIDGIQRSELLSEGERPKFTDLDGPSPGLLLRVVVDLERKPTDGFRLGNWVTKQRYLHGRPQGGLWRVGMTIEFRRKLSSSRQCATRAPGRAVR